MQIRKAGTLASKAKSMRRVLTDIIAILVVFFVLTTLFQSYFEQLSINRIIGGMLALAFLMLAFINIHRRAILSFCMLIVCGIMSFAVTLDTSREITDWIYLFSTILMIETIRSSKNIDMIMESFTRKRKLISWVIHAACASLLVLLVFKIGYQQHWGGSPYFQGLTNSQHTMASVSCLILTLILFYCRIHGKHLYWYAFLAVIPLLAIFETGARIFLFPAALNIIFFLRLFVKRKSIRMTLYFMGAAVFVYMLRQSSMVEKFIYTLTTTYASNPLAAFTSGRTEFWMVDIEYYLSGNLLDWVLGRSFSHVYMINQAKVNMYIWSHNDIIFILNGAGMLGASIYIHSIYAMLKSIKKSIKLGSVYWLVALYLLVPMLLNGFYIYQHYVYSFILLYLSIKGGFDQAAI